MTDILHFFATTPKGMEPLLADELRPLGASRIQVTRAGAGFHGPLSVGYRVCLWSRTASRVLLNLTRFAAPSEDALYAGVKALPWHEHLAPTGSLAVNLTSSASRITHTHYGALRVKDAIVDQFRESFGARPSVDLERPDVRINVSLHRDQARLSLDLSGESLHRRGYRAQGVAAPLKENLAAAILLQGGWPDLARADRPFLDPMCGSGTLPIEAALMAGDIAPGLLRDYFGFLGWRGHHAAVWDDLLSEARERRSAGLGRLPLVAGFDADPRAVRVAARNVDQAGLAGHVHIERGDLDQARPPEGGDAGGLLATNPPYGQRMGRTDELTALYTDLGKILRERFSGWRAAVFTASPVLAKHIRLRPERSHSLYNGPLACRLLIFDLRTGRGQAGQAPDSADRSGPGLSPGAQMFSNRLRKKLRHLGRWAKRENVDCYRLYDTDLPDYALALDVYEGAQRWVHIQEYEAPPTVDPDRAGHRMDEAVAVIRELLAPAELFVKVRRRQRGSAQYQKLDQQGVFREVREEPCRFLVNFTDYLDTGLFLDHRPTRRLIGRLAAGQRFLNLFGYTGTATVHAALGGATESTTVDLSATYLEWARCNFRLNDLDPSRHVLVRADCMQWLETAAQENPAAKFGLIFLDPPSFSNSKRMRSAFDVQRDHVGLIRQAARLLKPGGEIVFSTNRRGFRMEEQALSGLSLEDISPMTIPRDFSRNPAIHRCWRIRREPT